MEGIIGKIKVYPEKGSKGVELSEGRLIENLGLEGDCHAKGGDRQISLLFTECRENSSDSEPITEKGLCHDRFRENIAVKYQAPFHAKHIAPGMFIEAGAAVLEITRETKHCHEECNLYKAGKSCSLAARNLFARVVKGGVIRTGEKTFVINSF